MHGKTIRGRRTARSFAILAALAGTLHAPMLAAQALTGITGLVTVPTAAMPPDGSATVGVHWVDPRYHRSPYGDNTAVYEFADIAFLPFVEVGLRLTRVLDTPGQALGDRMISVRLRVLEEGARTPAVVVGAHDLVGTRIYHTTYVAASREIDGVPLAGTVGLHAGYGGQWLGIRAKGEQFQGFFGGISVSPRPWISLLAEHDAERVNAGVRLRVWRLNLLGAAYGMDGLSGGISYTHQLKK
jgi:hypothetical protein